MLTVRSGPRGADRRGQGRERARTRLHAVRRDKTSTLYAAPPGRDGACRQVQDDARPADLLPVIDSLVLPPQLDAS